MYLGPAPILDAAPDTEYLNRFAEAVPAPSPETGRALRPRNDAESAALIRIFVAGNQQELQLACIAAAGLNQNHPVSKAAVRLACTSPHLPTALGALLAPITIADDDLAAVAYLAADSGKPFELRAAAVGRLLETDCPNAWPLARSIFRTGTAIDEDAPWARWPRTGRYELGKRLLLESVNQWLRRHGEAPTDYEPNGSWQRQARQIMALEERAQRARRQVRIRESEVLNQASWRLMEKAIAQTPRPQTELLALGLLHPHNSKFLQGSLASFRPGMRSIALQTISHLPQ